LIHFFFLPRIFFHSNCLSKSFLLVNISQKAFLETTLWSSWYISCYFSPSAGIREIHPCLLRSKLLKTKVWVRPICITGGRHCLTWGFPSWAAWEKWLGLSPRSSVSLHSQKQVNKV
jgi:hypothetical protein